MIARSLRWRLLLGAGAAILIALAVAWAFMTLLFERHLDRRLEAELTRDALPLVAALSLDSQGNLALDQEPGDPRLQTPAGGFYWQVSDGGRVLQSRSLWDAALPLDQDTPSERWRLRRNAGPFGKPVALLERRVALDDGRVDVVVQLAQDTAPWLTARNEFARELAMFLLALWLVLAAAAWGQVTLGLRPLRRIRGDLAALHANAQARLPTSSLREIQPLTEAINALAQARERDLERARRRAADLAHGLKTPLAALAAQSRRAREAGAGQAADGMDRALDSIGATIEAELARARIDVASQQSARNTAIRIVVEQLVTVLEHTQSGERIAFDIEVPETLRLAIASDTLSEILGAVLENAVRYARRQVRVCASQDGSDIEIVIEDDGPGIATERMDEALIRGGRLDTGGAGTGLGLAIARDLVEATGGRIDLGSATLGGLRIRFVWPC